MCDYCKKQKDIINEYGMVLGLIEDLRGNYHFFINGNDYKEKINFCPICGEKLTPFEIIE